MNSTNFFGISSPLDFYFDNRARLNEIGASAFGRPVDEFGPDVADHFAGAEFAHIIGQPQRAITGFALYKLLRTSFWRRCSA
jgi:hypothetical protein